MNNENVLSLTPSELRLVHELMFFLLPSDLDAARKKLIEGPECDKKREFAWGDFLRRDAHEVYKTLAHKLDCIMMVSPTVSGCWVQR
jgi:hypothetical protein